MVYEVFSVYDSQVKVYMKPFCDVSKAMAHRGFIAAVNDSNLPIGKDAHAYSLFHIGQFDDETGRYENLHIPELVVSALTVFNG